MNTKDKRVKRTRKILKNALAELLLEKSLYDITVRELTERADISRGAFYTHYQDIYELYEEMENDLLNIYKEMLVVRPDHSYRIIFQTLLEYMEENALPCKVFLCTGSESAFRDRLAALIEERTAEIVKFEMNSDEMKEDWKYLIRHYVYGMFGMTAMWIDSGFSFPKEKVVAMLMDIDEKCDSLYK